VSPKHASNDFRNGVEHRLTTRRCQAQQSPSSPSCSGCSVLRSASAANGACFHSHRASCINTFFFAQSRTTKRTRKKTRTWADDQRDGHPVEYRWRPLLNAAVWLTPTARMPCSNAANIGERKTWTQVNLHLAKCRYGATACQNVYIMY